MHGWWRVNSKLVYLNPLDWCGLQVLVTLFQTRIVGASFQLSSVWLSWFISFFMLNSCIAPVRILKVCARKIGVFLSSIAQPGFCMLCYRLTMSTILVARWVHSLNCAVLWCWALCSWACMFTIMLCCLFLSLQLVLKLVPRIDYTKPRGQARSAIVGCHFWFSIL